MVFFVATALGRATRPRARAGTVGLRPPHANGVRHKVVIDVALDRQLGRREAEAGRGSAPAPALAIDVE